MLKPFSTQTIDCVGRYIRLNSLEWLQHCCCADIGRLDTTAGLPRRFLSRLGVLLLNGPRICTSQSASVTS